jgi:hypothetical protein
VLITSENRSNAHRENPYNINPVKYIKNKDRKKLRHVQRVARQGSAGPQEPKKIQLRNMQTLLLCVYFLYARPECIVSFIQLTTNLTGLKL